MKEMFGLYRNFRNFKLWRLNYYWLENSSHWRAASEGTNTTHTNRLSVLGSWHHQNLVSEVLCHLAIDFYHWKSLWIDKILQRSMGDIQCLWPGTSLSCGDNRNDEDYRNRMNWAWGMDFTSAALQYLSHERCSVPSWRYYRRFWVNTRACGIMYHSAR